MMRLACLILAATPVAAETTLPTPTHQAANGDWYVLSCDADGYVLSPPGLASKGVLYLGRSCDAARDGGPTGAWCYANGGVLVTLPDREIGFPRQEVSCPERPDLGADCVCQ